MIRNLNQLRRVVRLNVPLMTSGAMQRMVPTALVLLRVFSNFLAVPKSQYLSTLPWWNSRILQGKANHKRNQNQYFDCRAQNFLQHQKMLALLLIESSTKGVHHADSILTYFDGLISLCSIFLPCMNSRPSAIWQLQLITWSAVYQYFFLHSWRTVCVWKGGGQTNYSKEYDTTLAG